MAEIAYDVKQGRATKYLGRVNLAIIGATAERRQGYDTGQRAPGGAQAPVALGAAPVVLSEIMEPVLGGKAERVTPLGYKTEVRAQPRILAKLAKADPRLQAATMLMDAVERIGSVKGADLGGTDSKAGVSDGGATNRVKRAARLWTIEVLVNG